jgi:hypothetical protein
VPEWPFSSDVTIVLALPITQYLPAQAVAAENRSHGRYGIDTAAAGFEPDHITGRNAAMWRAANAAYAAFNGFSATPNFLKVTEFNNRQVVPHDRVSLTV